MTIDLDLTPSATDAAAASSPDAATAAPRERRHAVAGLYNLHESCDSAEHRAVFDRLEELILAGKTCGAGGGGFLLLCAKPGRREECAAAVAELGAESWPFEFDFEGVSVTEETAWTEEEVGSYRGRITGEAQG